MTESRCGAHSERLQHSPETPMVPETIGVFSCAEHNHLQVGSTGVESDPARCSGLEHEARDPALHYFRGQRQIQAEQEQTHSQQEGHGPDASG